MLVHLGRGVSVQDKNIIALTDIQRAWTPDPQALAAQCCRSGLVRELGPKPKTLVICREGTQNVCYLSCVGLRTLRQRMEARQTIECREVQHG